MATKSFCDACGVEIQSRPGFNLRLPLIDADAPPPPFGVLTIVVAGSANHNDICWGCVGKAAAAIGFKIPALEEQGPPAGALSQEELDRLMGQSVTSPEGA